jgi:hypothetical protein
MNEKIRIESKLAIKAFLRRFYYFSETTNILFYWEYEYSKKVIFLILYL